MVKLILRFITGTLFVLSFLLTTTTNLNYWPIPANQQTTATSATATTTSTTAQQQQ
jgi:hypothetical protein